MCFAPTGEKIGITGTFEGKGRSPSTKKTDKKMFTLVHRTTSSTLSWSLLGVMVSSTDILIWNK
jgi:hypothetical protein